MSLSITRRDLTVDELRAAARTSKNVGQSRRCLATASVREGHRRGDAAEAAGMRRQTLRDWMHRYKEEGVAGLLDRPKPMRARLLSPEQLAEFDGIVETGPDVAVDGVVRWRRVDLNEARVGQKGTLAYVWARQGTRPRAVHDTRYISAYIYGAICPGRGVGAGLVMPKANAAGLNEKAVTPGAHAVLILYSAGWRKSGDITIPPNISL